MQDPQESENGTTQQLHMPGDSNKTKQDFKIYVQSFTRNQGSKNTALRHIQDGFPVSRTGPSGRPESSTSDAYPIGLPEVLRGVRKCKQHCITYSSPERRNRPT